MSLFRKKLMPATLAMLCITASIARAQPAHEPQMPAVDLVRATVANEIAANDSSVHHLFRSRTQTPKGSQTKLYVETSQAMAAMLIAVNDQPITVQQLQNEDGHLEWLEDNPDQLRKKQAREKEDADRSLRIVKALPDAFVYQYDGFETGTEKMGRPGAQLVRLKFSPNPAYSPPSHVEQALSGMDGSLLIDPETKRLALIDGNLFKDVSFGWGLVGRLNKGGHFRVRQADLGDGSWDITEMDLNITGKILLVRSLTMISDEIFSDFSRVPYNLTFAQAVEMLKAEQKKELHVSQIAPSSPMR